ncbi:hypothetical protein [Yoonia sediminilitoris]|uniref:Transposase n=1 Tax=Yoonia sediminilitoris TaxID=1286148 RepID=A0A2T6KET1_9RHOB|nr:hypothetical protein [Yoonia sediminilitoris]PUB13631.1 transposase [Yoonia sediminilitoris]RCW94801.1 transposase [Yoonia sediminilitoris]
MATRYTDEFRRDAERTATTSGLTRPQISSDLGIGLSKGRDVATAQDRGNVPVT